MVVSISARGAVGIRKEASFASGGGVDNWQVVESSNLTLQKVHIFQDRVANTPEQVGGQLSHYVLNGPIVFPVSPSNPTQWWEAGIGGTGPYTPQIPLGSLAIQEEIGQIAAEGSSGDMIASLELSSSKGDILRCSVSIEGQNKGARAAGSPSFASGDNAYIHSECTFTLDGVPVTNIESFSMTKENNNILDLFGSTTTRREIPATKAVVTGQITMLFEDTNFRNRFMNNLPSSIVALYERNANSFKIELNNVHFVSDSRPLEGQTSFILETLAFQAFVEDPDNGNSLKVTVV